MFKRHFISAIIFGMAATAPPLSAASQFCADRERITDRLTVQFGEQQAGLGLQSAQRLVELWASADSGSWTILLTKVDGTSCILATGKSWVGTNPGPRGSKDENS